MAFKRTILNAVSNSLSGTLGLYLMRKYALNFTLLLLGLLGIVYLFDVVELLRRGGKLGVPATLILQMGLLKLPDVGQQIFPFVILFSAMFTFWQLSKRHELVVMRSAGLSVWQFMMPIAFVALIIGVLHMSAINPFGSLLMKKFEGMEAQHLKKQSSVISLSNQGLWLRQENEDGSMAILHAGAIQMPEWGLKNVIVFFFEEGFVFKRRIDAPSAVLDKGEWRFNNAVSNEPQRAPEKSDFILMATDLTIDEIEESFSDPQTISFWELPNFIRVMQQTGFDARPLQVHFQKLLSMPLLFLAMVFLAAAVSLRPPRKSGGLLLVLVGISLGFVVFFMSNFLQALGASSQIPTFVAAWFPSIITFLLGIGAIMTLEDG
ncbi:MAG: LPS export ABC transporter permease LptG [Alphaproteobacteria bacterium]|nr:LPS export ABC transporter permease LptG [Alphaproteobacteria bacterium]NCQ88615.1 LPS export ABC transporter permease LptG [Alphaproteobacteria bacterium]NCT06158.1 LPS export ABC transporter permease LptG [Alphaproteobacteria bacterium]